MTTSRRSGNYAGRRRKSSLDFEALGLKSDRNFVPQIPEVDLSTKKTQTKYKENDQKASESR